jgi:hypothetical protein
MKGEDTNQEFYDEVTRSDWYLTLPGKLQTEFLSLNRNILAPK